MLSVVVIPRHAIVIKKCEQSIPILRESFLVSGRNLGLVDMSEDFPEKAVDSRSMLTEVSSLQPKSVH
jgi:hypothetical protein